MTKRDKLIQKILSHGQVSADEATRLLLYLGYQVEQDSTSHKVFRKAGHPTLSLKNRKQLLPYQLHDLKEVLNTHGYERS